MPPMIARTMARGQRRGRGSGNGMLLGYNYIFKLYNYIFKLLFIKMVYLLKRDYINFKIIVL